MSLEDSGRGDGDSGGDDSGDFAFTQARLSLSDSEENDALADGVPADGDAGDGDGHQILEEEDYGPAS